MLMSIGLLLAWMAPAFSDDAQKSCPDRGTKMTVSSGMKLEFEGSDGLTCNIKNMGTGNPFSFYGLIWYTGTLPDNWNEVRQALNSFWPLTVGKTVSVDDTLGSNAWTNTFTVVGRQSLSVPAGTFDVFVVNYRYAGVLGTAKGDAAMITLYVAPKLGYFVKRDFQRLAGNPQVSPSWEATTVTPP